MPMKRFFIPVIFLLVIGLSACSSTPPQYWLTVHVYADKNINPNIDGKPSPVELRFYELTDDQAFKQNSFIALFENDQGLLKDKLLLKRTLVGVEPDSKQTHKYPLAEKTRYIGIISAFADYQGANNQIITAIKVKNNVVLDVFIDGTNITTRKQD